LSEKDVVVVVVGNGIMNISNDYCLKTKIRRQNSPLFPDNVRGLIIGKSNCGKTTLLFNLLLRPGWLDYNRLYVFGKSLHQPEYKIIKNGFEDGLSKRQISNIFTQQDVLSKANVSPLDAIDEYNGIKEGGIVANFYNDCAMIPDPTSLDATEKNLLILDDCFLGKQSKAEAYYSRGRHNNCDTIYISQNYFRLPRQTIRENSNFIILFPQDAKNLTHIYADHCSQDISLGEFKNLCKDVWKLRHNFITIDLTSSSMNGKYRKNLDCFYLPDTIGKY
tara:strand:- start:521 stop:1351 length:831 start_codon:yes stop_codon:yes gene_type:complete